MKCGFGGKGVALWWVHTGATYFFRKRYDSGMDTKKELWNRLENEPERAYRAFECFLSLPSGERTLLAAYRRHVDNPDAAKPSDTWSGWSSSFAWRERAAAYDDHLASVRREAYERAVEEEAARQALEVEKARGRTNELMTLSYERAVEWLENAQPSDLRAQDVLAIMRLHMDYVKAFGVEQEPKDEDDWTEEDEADIERIIREVEAEGDPEEDWGDSEEDEDEQD
jgi:hypothetical protein